MRLKQNLLMILLLTILLVSMTLGGMALKKQSSNHNDTPGIVDDVIPQSFCKQIENGDIVPQDVMNFVQDFLDDYFLSLYKLEKQDMSVYFSNDKALAITEASIDMNIKNRKAYDFDFTMSDGYYTIKVTNYSNNDNKYYIDFLMDDCSYFKFLNGISSERYDIENSIVVEKVDNGYKIVNYDSVQSSFIFFNEEGADITKLYEKYSKNLMDIIELEKQFKQLADIVPFSSDKAYVYSYNRDAAVKYCDKYYHTRNNEWYDFSEEGNCQNFGSQVLIAGGLKMDFDGDEDNGEVWYFENGENYSSSWAGVPYFYDYCLYNHDNIVSEVNVNIYYAEPGDIIQIGTDDVDHTMIVSKIVDGHILANGNSMDMKDYPLEALVNPTRRLIKILGGN